jgi:hypothetical protein
MKFWQAMAVGAVATMVMAGGLGAMAAEGGLASAGASPARAAAVGSDPVRVIDYGDSLAMEAGNFFNYFLGPSATVVNRSYGGTSPCTWAADMWHEAGNFVPQAMVMQFSGDAFSPCMQGHAPGTLGYYFKYAADTEDVIALFNAVGARVYIAGYPVSLSSPPWWNVLNQVFAAVAAQHPNAVFVDAGASLEANGNFTWTLPCAFFEPCGVPCKNQAVVPGSNCVRDPAGAHTCPDGNETFTGFTGYCDEWSSGAFRYGLAMASGPVRDFRL